MPSSAYNICTIHGRLTELTINQQHIAIPHEHYAYYSSMHKCTAHSRVDTIEVYLQCIHLLQSVFVVILTLFAVPDCATGMNERSSRSQHTIFKITIESHHKVLNTDSHCHTHHLYHCRLQYCTMAFCRNIGIDGARQTFQPC